MTKEERIEGLAARIPLLFEFISLYIEDRDLLIETRDELKRQIGFNESAMPIVYAHGLDGNRALTIAKAKLRRTEALINIIDALVETNEVFTENPEKEEQRIAVARAAGIM